MMMINIQKIRNTIDVYIIYQMTVYTFFSFSFLFAIDFCCLPPFPEDDDIRLMCLYNRRLKNIF